MPGPRDGVRGVHELEPGGLTRLMKAPRTIAMLIVREKSWARKKKNGRNGTKNPTQTPWSMVDQ